MRKKASPWVAAAWVVLACMHSAAAQSTLWREGISLIPYPHEVVLGGEDFTFGGEVSITLEPQASAGDRFAAEDLAARLKTDFGIAAQVGGPSRTRSIRLLRRAVPGKGGDQGYELKVGKDRIDVLAGGEAGLFYGTRTLLQIVQRGRAAPFVRGMTIRDWPEMPNVFGQWPYLGVARLVEQGYAIGIEGDADGALSAWIAENLGLGRCYLSDWLEHDGQTVTLWHGGAAPLSLCEPVGKPGGPRIARHFNIKKPAVIEATIRAGLSITVFRFWRCDGKYLLTASEGETIRPKRHLMATNALARLNCDPREWFEAFCHAGMPHHVAVVQGHHAGFLKRLARMMRFEFV